jgi:ketosteroid isomerase-like protein
VLGTAYEALAGGDSSPLLGLLGDDFEWVEPELEGYPLSGVHRGAAGVRDGVLGALDTIFDSLRIQADEVVEGDLRVVVTGVIRGRPSGMAEDWDLPFAHIWEIEGGRPVRVRAYFDRSRLTVAAARRQLADVADDLLEQAAEIRRQWDRLGDTLRAGGAAAEPEQDDEDDEAESEGAGAANSRLAAVDMAQDGASREDVEQFLREEFGLEDPAPILDEVFGAPGADGPPPSFEEQRAVIEANRLSRLFARNRD